MKAVILAGGEASRLRPLTNNTPKSMVPVLNTPCLEHAIRHLGRHNVKDILLAKNHLSQSIENYFGDGGRFGVDINYSIEDAPLGTAGAVKNAEKYLDGAFLVLNGDIFTDLDITAMMSFHVERKAKITIALTPVDDPTSYGLVETDAQGRVTRFLEKPDWNQVTTNTINAGTYILEPEALAGVPPQANFSFERELFPSLLKQDEPIYAYSSPAYWIDIGTPEKYHQLHRDLLSGKSSQYSPASGEEIVIGRESHVHPTAQLVGPILIGNNCSIGKNVKLSGHVAIGDGCTILEDTVIEKSIIWQNARVGTRVILKNSILADNCRLEDNSIVEDSILGDNVTVTSGCKLQPGSKIQPETTVEPET